MAIATAAITGDSTIRARADSIMSLTRFRLRVLAGISGVEMSISGSPAILLTRARVVIRW